MKVSNDAGVVGSTPNVAGGKTSGNVQPAATSAPATVQGDALSVSSGAQFIAAARAELDKIPDIRADKVSVIKAQIDADTYNPDAEAVADGLVREHTPPTPGSDLM
jgi:flagellar biosynthesis anti-sigma factor FlgM